MNKYRTKIYVFANVATKELTYTGIQFKEFCSYLSNPINNLMVLKGDFSGNMYCNNFELAQGKDVVDSLQQENIQRYGDFCFVDYSKNGDVENLSAEHIAHLLYLSHMFKPIDNPFFKTLNNRFVYLSHDDFYCKLYCRNFEDFIDVFNKKIMSFITNKYKKYIKSPDISLNEDLLSLMKKGLLLDLEDILISNEAFKIPIYIIGKRDDMDYVINNIQKLKSIDNLYGHLIYIIGDG